MTEIICRMYASAQNTSDWVQDNFRNTQEGRQPAGWDE